MADSSEKLEVAVEIKKLPPLRWNVLQRVPAPMRGNKKQKHIYEPVAVPLGPYHHGRLSEYHAAEQLKEELLDMVFGNRNRGLPLGLVTERVAEIRQFYGGADGYGDEELAVMMLRDTCLVVCCINLDKYFNVISERLGYSGAVFMYRDLFMLENQIPLWLINLLIPFASDDDDDDVDGELLLRKFLSWVYYKGNMMTMIQLPWGNGQGVEPLHLLEALHRTLLHLVETDHTTDRKPPKSKWQLFDSQFRSATDLKAKGIHFRPSSRSLKDIRFFSFSTHGRLQLPVFFVSPNSKAVLSNLIAYEMSSDGTIDRGVIRYVNFMKTLLHKAEDVRLMREKGVLYSMLANDDEVLRMFQDTDAYGFSDQRDLDDVKKRIEEHCSDRGKTWLTELINTYCRSPLTIVALFTAAFIVVLSFLQTFYAINPKYANAAP